MTNAEWLIGLGAKFSDLSKNEQWKDDGTCRLYIYREDEDHQGRTMIDSCSITREEAAGRDLMLVWLDRPQDFLTAKEREYLRDLIPHLPYPNKISGITKEEGIDDHYYIQFHYYESDKTIEFPTFKGSKMYRGLDPEEFYTLDELDLLPTED